MSRITILVAAAVAAVGLLVGSLWLVSAVTHLPRDIPGREMYPDSDPDGTRP